MIGEINVRDFKIIIGCCVLICINILMYKSTEKMVSPSPTKSSFEVYRDSSETNIKDVSDKIIRFHVIANSDSAQDQRVKLDIRDAILNNVGDPLSRCKTRDESLKFLKNKISSIEEIADDILKSDGEKYKAKAMLGNFNFPIKSYGEITLPQGEYKAVRVVLGEGEGKNWWCVMFPPLCFIDITRGLTSEETNKSLQKVLNPNEVKKITTLEAPKKSGNGIFKKNIKLRFKSIDIIKKVINKIKL